MDYNLRPLWDAILDLYERFDAYCKKHGLRYYVTGGTLLGAVRHNGFIPWDDDFDVVMPRPDYKKLVEGFATDGITDARILTWKSVEEWGQLFAKICETRTDVIARVQKASRLKLSDGICIDVIPIDGMPKATIPFYYWALKRSTWRHKESKSLIWRLLFSLLWDKEESSVAGFERWLASYDYDSSPCVEDYNANGRRFKLRALDAKSFGAPIMHEFDRVSVPMPREYEKFLEIIFGNNYMQLPPLERRKPSHQIA